MPLCQGIFKFWGNSCRNAVALLKNSWASKVQMYLLLVTCVQLWDISLEHDYPLEADEHKKDNVIHKRYFFQILGGGGGQLQLHLLQA